jgi:hypothetical protein
MIETLLAEFPQLDDTATATIYRAFNEWWLSNNSGLDTSNSDDERIACLGFAAGWIKRPTSDW